MEISAKLHPALLRAFESVPDLYLILAPDMTILTASDAYLAATSTRREEIKGKSIFDAFPNNSVGNNLEAVDSLARSLQQVLLTGKADSMPLQQYDTPNDEDPGSFTTKYWRPLNSPVLDEQGEVLYIIHKVEDATAQKVAEEKLEEEFRNLKNAQAIGHIGSFERQLYEDTLTWSDELYRIHGLEPQSEVITVDRLLSFIHPDDRQETIEAIRHTHQTGIPLHLTQRIVRTDGAIRYVHRSAQILKDKQGNPVKVYGTVQDITERTKAEQLLLRLEEELKQKERDKYRALFNSIDEGVYLCEVIFDEANNPVDIRYLEENPAAVSIMGKSFLGKTLKEINPGYKDFWFQTWGSVAMNNESKRLQQYSETDNKWFDFHISKASDDDSQQVVVVFQDITDRKEAERGQQYLLKLNDAIRALADPEEVQYQAVCLLGDYVGAANAFYSEIEPDGDSMRIRKDYHNGTQSQTGFFRISDFGPFISEEHQAGRTVILQDAASDSRLSEAERAAYASLNVRASVCVPIVRHNKLTSILAVSQSTPRTWSRQEVSLIQETAERTCAAVERAKAEKALQESEQRFRNLVEASSRTIWEADPTGLIVTDSPSWRAFTGQTFDEFKGYGWANAVHPQDRSYMLSQWQEAVAAKRNLDTEFRLRSASGNWRWSHVIATPILDADGQLVKWAGMNIDIHDRKLIEKRLKSVQESLSLAVEAAQLGTWELDLVEDESTNRSFRHDQIFGYSAPQTKWSKAIARNHIVPEDRPIFDTGFDRAMETGKLNLEVRVRWDDDSIHWMSVRGRVYFDNQGRAVTAAGVNYDITDRKKAEQNLKDFNRLLEQQVVERTAELEGSKQFLQTILDSSLDMIQVFEAVRDEDGSIIDFVWLLNNNKSKELFGAAKGKRLLELNPGARQAGLFDAFVRVALTGEPQQYEQHFNFENIRGWYEVSIVKLGDGVAATIADITVRKDTEQAFETQYQVLRQAEEVADIGSWEFDLSTGAFTWSEGMYQLFGLPKGSSVSPKTYLEHVLKEDRPVAEKLMQRLSEGLAPLEETLRIRVADRVVTLKVKGAVLRDKSGKPAKVLGVDVDISEVKRLEQENLQMRLEQQKSLLIAILNAQEEERRRISEALHNGVGQILYAAKIHLHHYVDEKTTAVGAESSLLQVDQILELAIQQTRSLSHELAPAVLEQFGLEAAFKEIGNSLSSQTLQIQCLVYHLPEKLEQHTMTAVYRIAQEMANNIVRHADATEASLLLRSQQGKLILIAEDNGKGFDMDSVTAKGIGLQSVKDRVKLLNGTFSISSSPGNGTQVKISLPLAINDKAGETKRQEKIR